MAEPNCTNMSVSKEFKAKFSPHRLPPEIMLEIFTWVNPLTLCELARTTPSIAKLCEEHAEFLKQRIISQQLSLPSAIFKPKEDLIELFSKWQGYDELYSRPFGDNHGYILFLELVRQMTLDVFNYLRWRLNWRWPPTSEVYTLLLEAVFGLWPLMHALARFETVQAGWDYFATLPKSLQKQCIQCLLIASEDVIESHNIPWDNHIPRYIINILTHPANRDRLDLVYQLYTFNSVREGMTSLWCHRMQAAPSDNAPPFDLDTAFFGPNTRGNVVGSLLGNICHSLFGHKTHKIRFMERADEPLPLHYTTILVPWTEPGGAQCGNFVSAMLNATNADEGKALNWAEFCFHNVPGVTGTYLVYEDGYEEGRGSTNTPGWIPYPD